ncbi:hypothetical protein [Sphingomicrobium aestuariivivum]|uniref:hypothetical protein n=1 Tax=Sphingomicrobium aestuariivivum TaxID=1582356 RepID=UPI001FD63D87|nr:hypothetical protein [Sphingomicrobium aestuariivivum]MCJ8191484.1 hypothetical protein [Sphingomicrobium aestuariivivum]
MLGEGRGEEVLVGVVAALMVVALSVRIGKALRTGEIPLYRTRIARADAGDAKFYTLVGINAAVLLLLVVIAVDLIGGFGWR